MGNEPLCKFSSKNYAVNRFSNFFYILFEFVIPIPNHPVHFRIWSCNEAVNAHYDLEF